MVYALSSILVLWISVSGSEMLGKYEFWDYFGPYVHDYSGNLRHGLITTPGYLPILTDRGIYIRNYFSIQFPSNRHSEFPTSHTDMVFSILLYPKLDNLCLLSFNISGLQTEICFTNIQGSLFIKLQGSITLSQRITTNLKTWKVFSIRLTQRTAGVYLSVYLDGEDTNTALYMLIAGVGFDGITSYWSFGTNSGSIEGFLYGIWWHGSISITIKILTKSIIGGRDDSCATYYALEPWRQCLSYIDDPYKNSAGDSCNLDCTSLDQSCRRDGSCIEGCTYKCITSFTCRSPSNLSCSDSCPSNCKNCISGSDYCIECEPGYAISYDKEGLCTFEVPYCLTLDASFQCVSCEVGYYLTDYSPQACEICPDGCLSCTISLGQITCNECPEGYFIQIPGVTPICTDTCGFNGYDYETIPNRCKACGDDQCNDCMYNLETHKYDCTSCSGLRPILFQNSCISGCPSWHYRVGNICSLCPSNCVYCSDSSTCTQCGQGFYLSGSTCYPCMADHYISDTLIGSLSCILCDNQLCSKCQYGYYLTFDKCLKCIPNCLDCENSLSCNICMEGYYTIEEGFRCVPECKTNLHRLGDGSCYLSTLDFITICTNNIRLECTHSSNNPSLLSSYTISCDIYCIFCFTNNGEYTCSFCNAGFYLTYDKTQCVSSCGDGYYQDITTFECIPCSDPLCKNCNNNVNECQECLGDNYIHPNNSGCNLNCPDHYFKDIISGIRICSECMASCKTCTSIFDCSECLSDYYLYNPTPTEYSCIEYCITPYYGASNFKCILCPMNCDVCENEIRCIRCSVGYTLNSDYSCVEFTCSPNSIHCYIESGLYNSYGCESGYYLQPTTPTTCESSCPPYSYLEEIPIPKCIECPLKCYECDNIRCKKCDIGYYLTKDPTDINLSCKPCPENCQVCDYIEDKIECISCNEEYYLQPEGESIECDRVCPEGFYIDVEDDTCKESPAEHHEPNSNGDISDNDDNSTITEDFKSIGIATALGVFIASTIVCMIKLNLNALWCIFNTIQIYPYIPILNINIPPRTLGVYQAFSSLNVMVNIFSYFIQESGPYTTGKLEDAGYNTGQILLNSGQSLSMLAILIVLYLIVLILSKILKSEEDGCIGKYVQKLIQRMTWNLFLRFFIEAYLDLTIGSLVNLNYVILI